MANSWPLLIEVDCPEPRPQKGRLIVAADGTTWDLAKSSNVWLEPSTLTLMLAPLPVTAAWRTTYAGNYARYQKTDYTLTTPASWKQMQIKASGDYYLQSLNVTERATLTTAWSANQPAYISLYVPGLKDSDDTVILKAGWGVGSAGSVEVWFAANGSAQVYKSGSLVGTYQRNDSNIAPQANAVYLTSVASDFITIMMIPCRRRELVVSTSTGLAFSHVFADLSPATANTIVPAASFSWLVPQGQASVQLAKLQFATSGYGVSPVKKLRYAPPTGATFSNTYAYDAIGPGSASASYSVVKDDLTAYTPNGVITDVRAKVTLSSSTGSATYGFYEIDLVYDPEPGSTADDPVDITCDVERLSISVDDNGRATCSVTTRRKPITDAGVDQPQITSDRPIRIALSDGAVSPTYIDVFRGTLTPPEITYEEGDTTKDWSIFVYSGQDRSRDFDLAYIVESYPYDGLTAVNAIGDLMYIAGYDGSTYFAGDTPLLELPYSPNISKGQYALAPDFFDTVGGYIDKLKNDYYANWIIGWMPTTSGYLYIWQDTPNASTTPVMTLYQSIAAATTAGITEVLRPKRVVRRMSSHYETPEATQVQVVGQDPATGLFITKSLVDTAAETASTAPASRPYNWRGRPVPYQLRDPALTTQDAVDQACDILYDRLTTGRILIEWESDFLVLSSNNRPLWLGDVVRIMEPDGTTTKGDYRIIGIPTIDFVTEQTSGFSVRKAVYRGQKSLAMPYLDGTRTATLTMSHTQNVLYRIWNPFATQPLEPDYNTHHTNFTFGGHLGFSASLTIATYINAPSPGSAWTWELRANITVNNGHGSTATSYKVLASGSETGSTNYVDASATCAGDFSASVSVDKLWDIAEDSFSSTSAPTRFPSLTSYTWYERTTTGATAACSLSAGGSAVSVSAAATSRRTADYTATLDAYGFSSGDDRHDFAVSLVKVNGTAVHDITHAHTFHNQSATEWSLSVLGETDGFGIVSTASADIGTSSCLDRNVSIAGRIRAWEGAYPDALNVVVTGYDGGTRTVGSSGGSYGATDTFVDYSTTSVLIDPTYGTDTLTTQADDVPAWISAELSGSGLTTNGDSSTDNRVLFRGWRFNGWSISETNNRSIAGTGNDRLYAPYEGMSGYRYLQIQIKAQSGTNATGTIELTDYHGNWKRWQVVAPTTSYSTVTLDLCSPDTWSLGATPATDDKDNPYPRKNTASSSYAGSESVDSAYWGITSCQRLRVQTGSIDIGTTTLVYTNTDSTYCPDSFTAQLERITPAIVSEADTTTYYYGRRFWQQDRDGRTEEESDVWWQKTVGGATGVTTYSVDPVTISELCDQINASDNSIVRHPGWTATNSVAYPAGATCSASQPPLRDCFLNGVTGYSTWLRGGGILATPNATSGTDFAYGHQLAQGTIVAQTLFDRINGNFPPDLNDPIDVNGGTDSGLYLPAGSLLRGIAHGALLDNAGDPLTTGTVDLVLTSTSANRGTDSTIDAEGRYYTSTPWGLGESNHQAVYSTDTIGILPLHTSHRFRCWFREQELGGVCVSAAVAPNQRMCYAVIESGAVALHFADGPNATNWQMQLTSITDASCVHIAYDPTSAIGRLYIVVDASGSDVKSYYTDDEGVNVSVAVTVTATGDDASVAINPMGKRIVIYHHNNDLYRVIYDPQGNVITAGSVIISGGVSNGKTAIAWRLGVWYAYYRDGGNSLIQISSIDDGETWS